MDKEAPDVGQEQLPGPSDFIGEGKEEDIGIGDLDEVRAEPLRGQASGPPGNDIPEIKYGLTAMVIEVLIFWIISFAVSVSVGVVYPFLFLVCIPLGLYVKESKDIIHFTAPAGTFAFGYIPGMIIIWFVETILFVICIQVFFAFGVNTSPDSTSEERDDGFIIFWLFASFFVFAVTTEVGKYLILKYARLVWPNALEMKGSIIMTVAGALGFSISNNVILLLIHASYENWDIGTTFLWAIYLSFVLDTVHCLTAYYIALSVIRKEIFDHDLKLYHILSVPIIARGILVFCSSPIAAFLNGAVMWTVIIIVELVIIAGLLLLIKHSQSKLPREHIERGGYFTVLGVGSEPESMNLELEEGVNEGKEVEVQN